MRRVLILGGTSDARAVAAALVDEPGVEVVSSLAGRVRDPRLPEGEVRVGGFGGVDGLREYLREHRIDAVVDATHPFAARITANAATAAERVGVPLLVLRRPEWSSAPGDLWTHVPSLAAAAAALPALGSRVLLTIGRQGVEVFATVDAEFWVRAIDPPDGAMPVGATLLLARGPFDVESERDLMRTNAIDVLVTKNSGGALTEAKLTAARELRVPVLMVDRPPLPAGSAVVTDVAAAAAWARRPAD
ncbi:cobalt-precorrin-6A reductase [Rhodococcus spelaei]|uniref:Cobalt-precorrin-6A reductase n=1 Tax=Rhodococcus spelaei TaxID=2546320 RepID=A0A541B7U3_9NOCA|nr:cobalt-precorrin-6A reductase [Rhodococcus spelaei]TQF68368.1 cobalt-precorrin-6A reductase [Rhodococcus spelaei]